MGRIAGFRLVAVPVSDKTVWSHVVLASDDGLEGIGEYTFTRGAIDADVEAAAGGLVGLDLGDARAAVGRMRTGTVAEATVRSALDQALCDISARADGIPLSRYLSADATGAPIPVYANINRRTVDRSPAGFAASANDALAAGHTVVKMAPFDGVQPSTCEGAEGERLVAAGLDRVRAVADAVAGRAEVQIDCHWRFTPARARRLVAEAAACGVVWLECPLPETVDAVADLRAIRSLANDAGMRLAGCETMACTAGFAPYLEGGAYDVIMPDVKHAGGLAEILRIGDMGARHGTSVSIHNPSGPIAHFFSVHAARALGTEVRHEFQFDESPLFMEITTPAPELRSDTALVPEGPGLGAVLAEPPGS